MQLKWPEPRVLADGKVGMAGGGNLARSFPMFLSFQANVLRAYIRRLCVVIVHIPMGDNHLNRRELSLALVARLG